MKTTIDHLLTPRFEVIADYPDSTLEIGMVLNQEVTDNFSYLRNSRTWVCKMKNIRDFPNLFKPLQWWEKRTSDEMPKYLKRYHYNKKQKGHNVYHLIDTWSIDESEVIAYGLKDGVKPEICSVSGLDYQPCSEEEYLNNMNR